MKSNQIKQASAWGVCAAIADFYGFTSPRRMLSSLGHSAPTKWYAYTQDTVELLLSNRTIATDMDTSQLLNDVHFEAVYNSNTHSNLLKVCKHCLRDGVIHHLDWQAVEATVCSEHHTPLTTSCIHMYIDNNWNNSMQCNECDSTIPATIRMPEYERYLHTLSSETDRHRFICALKAVAERLIRPFDFIPSPIRWTKLAPSQVRVLLEDAFRLGEVPSMFTLWKQLLLQHRSELKVLGHAAMNIELVALELALSNVCWPKRNIKELNFEPAELLRCYHQAPIPEKMIAVQSRYQYCQDPINFSFLVTGVMVADLLGVHPKAVTELLSSGTLASIHACQQPDKQLFDIREIKGLLVGNVYEDPVTQHDFVCIKDIPNAIFELYDLTPETLVNKAFSGDVNSQIRINSTLRYVNNLQVSIEGLKALLKQAWTSLRDCPIHKVAKMLRTNSQIVEKLVEQGLLSLRPDEHELIEAESIQRFVDKYLLVNRKATFSQSRNIAQKISSCCGTQPVFSMYMNSTKTEFVVFRKQELASCCMQQVPKRFAHFSTPRVDLSKKAHSLFANISGDTNEHRYF